MCVQNTDSLFTRVHRALVGAGLTAMTERVGHRLLALADARTGQVNLTWEELAEVTGCENVNAARRYLTRLQGAKLIHYSTNDYVYVTWLGWMEVPLAARTRAGSSAWDETQRREDEAEMELFGESDAPAAARECGEQRVHAPLAARGRAAGRDYSQLVSQSDLVHDRGLTNRHRPSNDAERSVKLLMDAEVGLDGKTAQWLASRHGFDELLRQVMTWRRQMEAGVVKGAGALVHRVRSGYGAMMVERDKQSALYRRHVGEEDESLARFNKWVPEEYRDIIIH
jgi:hypothetical protein